MPRTEAVAIDVPRNYPTALVFMDEAGARASGHSFFVMSAVKTRYPGKLARSVQHVRDQTGFRGEFKFNQITRGATPAYFALIDALEQSDAHIAATVVRREARDRYTGKEQWQIHLDVASRLLVGCINRRELVSVVMDVISTPIDVALDDLVRDKVNRKYGATSIVTAACMNSKTHDGLQLADLVASAIAHDRRQRHGAHGGAPNTTSPKAKVAARLLAALGLAAFDDVRTPRLNIATLAPRGRASNVVPLPSPARTG